MPEQKRAGRPPYPAEVRERAVRMVFDHQDEYPSQWKAIESISAKLVYQPRDTADLGAPGRDRRRPATRAHDRRANTSSATSSGR